MSIKALRLYDRLDILQPAHLDPETGYRYYSQEQLPTARFIRTLRQMDVPLALVRELVAADRDTAVSLLTQYWQAYETRVLLVRRTTNELITQLKNEVKSMTVKVEVKEYTAQQVASISKHVIVAQLDATIRDTLASLAQFVEAQHGESTGVPFGIYHGPINETDNGPIEVCWPVNGTLTATGDIVLKELPATKAASVTVRGEMCDFPHILKAYDAAYDWIQANGYEMAESPRELWWSAPGPEGHMEIVWPFR
ncbi:MAG: MerR family transcriptional regulator [Anaerolineae bacterium]|nr:MerR family transcriptional regulator [Anaerolineae bacterium]